jgi:hypothetical protein
MALAGALALGGMDLLLAGGAAAQANEAEAVGGAVDALRKAMLEADKTKLAALTHDQLSYGHSDGRVQDKADFIAVIAEKKTIYKAINLLEPSVAVAGSAAVVRHRFTGETEAGGKPGTPNILALQVWQKTDGAWKLLARQGFKT